MTEIASPALAVGQVAITCPVCAAGSTTTTSIDGWGTWQRCQGCTLSFVHPLALPTEPQALFDRAYRGAESASGFGEFAERVRQRQALIDEPELWFWTPAFRMILDWLDRRVGPGADVLELGCGLGFFLHAMRRRGFKPAGVDVAETAVELNRADGFPVWHGTLATVPDGWAEPSAVVSMFMLHHLEDPLGFLASIRERWPTRPLAIAQYGPSNQSPYSAMPPRNLTQWNRRSLQAVLARAGYRAHVQELGATAVDARLVRSMRRAAFGSLARFPIVYRLGRRALNRVGRAAGARAGDDGFVLLAFAEPDE